MADARLLAAIQTLATKLIPKSTGDKQIGYISRLNEYSARLLTSVLPVHDDEPEIAVAEPLSSDPSIALAQILSATGNPITFDAAGATIAIAPGAVLGSASTEQVRQLALLGFFGQPGGNPGVDYSLFNQYYDGTGSGNYAPKEAYANTGTWAAYVASLS